LLEQLTLRPAGLEKLKTQGAGVLEFMES